MEFIFLTMYTCPFPGCNKQYTSVPGIRHHWNSSSGHPGECPKLSRLDLLAVQEQAMENTTTVDPADIDLIEMMGLTEGNVDTRSAGRFARASRLDQYSGVFQLIVLQISLSSFRSQSFQGDGIKPLARFCRCFFCDMYDQN